jgi:gamma-glutamylcysteine synthetase
VDPRRNPGDAEIALRDHVELHAEGRRARARHDVPDLHHQANLDFGDEADMVQKCESASRSSRSTALSVALTDGRPNGFSSALPHLAQPPHRTGMLPFV